MSNSVSGTPNETAEPADTTAAAASNHSHHHQATSTPSKLTSSKPTNNTITTTTKKLQPRRTPTPSAANSPLPSRESSPVRPSLNNKSTSSTARSAGGRSRKNSVQDVSPSRSSSTHKNPPSAAATQRALSAASIPTLHPAASEPIIRAPVPQKPSITSEIKDAPRWPVSPRLRSPPPTNTPSITSPRKTEQESPAINVQRISKVPEKSEGKQPQKDSEVEDSLLAPGMRTPARGASGASSTLETVQEISQPNTPARSFDGSEKSEDGSYGAPSEDGSSASTIRAKPSFPAANESGSESGGKGEIKMRSTPAPPVTALRPGGLATKSFSASAGAGRGKPSGESTRNMTVEAETVSSVPQVNVSGQGANGSIRAKPSSETIRPKKEKKKTGRKTPSVTSGTGEHPHLSRSQHHHHSTRKFTARWSHEWAYGQGSYSPPSSGATSPEHQVHPSQSVVPASRKPSLISIRSVSSLLIRNRPASSKADIFEAKVASAVDEADSSDSEETFVYESNPPDASDQPRRYHSRTPSATSMASQADQRKGSRSVVDGGHSVAMKKSMKFAHSSYNSAGQETTTGEDDGKGTARSNIGTGRGTTHHHHIGRWGRNGGNGHASIFDNESPFPSATKPKFSGNASRQSSRPTSPKYSNTRTVGNGKKPSPILSGYDLDDEADNEHTPLIPPARSTRSNNRGRRPGGSSMRQLEHHASRQNQSFFARFAGCFVLSIMIILVISGAVGFMFATTQPLTEVKVLSLKNVLASEQDVIFDVLVQARNPNIVAVVVDSSDLVLFAKSKYAGTDSEWWAHAPRPGDVLRRALRIRDDDPYDPPLGKDPSTNPNLEIGHVYELDSPLTFEGSPFHHSKSQSLGQIRVDHPGNKTSPAGSQRWGRVLQHEFELIVRGTLRYTLPLSQRVRSISVEGRVTVKPNAADQDPDTVHIIQGLPASIARG
ncbi:Vacuolar segregation protein 7 [Lachnellula arida]|uniref:Vacuolar segregation protein 7 n=1 Tax=Lachnellula arida TaxID=1316785 RepID=A0A8T9BGE3_9HELO|nr:Vacuolar segregation protein 7 [Lachnellula arida]